jgi:glycerol-3-phosphate acyltransferase PlsY
VSEAFVIVAGYLIGSIDFAVLVARRRGVDIYAEGSGNPGASNVSRVLGKRAGAAVMILDLLKGVVGAGIGELVGGSELLGFVAGGAAVVGHCFPIWHRFRGGKGVATTVGVLLWTIPLLGLALALLWAGVIVASRMASLGSLALVVLAIPGVWLWAEDGWSAVVMATISMLVIMRHAENIRRLLSGGEQTI